MAEFEFRGDEIDYFRIAVNLVSGRGYSRTQRDYPPEATAYRPPLFPAVLALSFRIFGPSPKYGVWINQAFIILLIPLTFWLGRLLYGDRCGILAAIITTLWPHGYFFGSFLFTEPLFAVFTTITFGLLVRQISFPSLKIAAAAGLTAGAAILTRSNFAVIAALLGFWFLFLLKQHKARRALMVFWGTVVIVLSPWAIRNYLVINDFNPGTTGSGVVFAGAHNFHTLSTCPGGWTLPQVEMADVDRVDQMSEIDRDQYFWKKGFHFLNQLQIFTLLKLFVLKFLRLWLPVQRIVVDGVCFPCNVITSVIFLIPFGLSFLGLCLLSSRKALFSLYIVFLAGTTLVSVLFYGTSRFRMPLEPLLWVLAAFAIIRLSEMRKTHAERY